MIILTAGQKQKQWRAAVPILVGFALLFGPADYVRAAGVSAKPADTGTIMVNNVWVDVPLSQVFRDISAETGVVIAPCPHVPDPLVSLDAGLGKPLKECLQELVAGRGLFVYPRNRRFYLITCDSPTCPTFMEVAKSKRLYLKYVSAKHLISSLPKSIREYVTSGERPNEVLIYTLPEIMERIMGIVRKLDVPRQQVVLEVLVVELQEKATEEFGIDWEYSDKHNSMSMKHGLGAFTGITRYTSVPKNKLTSLLLTLRALVGEKKASIRSRPRVATLNGQKATIDVSLDEYFTIVTDIYGSGNTLRTELEVIKSGVLLNITPHIGSDGDITVVVVTEVSDVVSRQNLIEGNKSGDLPIIRRRKADTTVRVKDGDAIVIGGLVESQERSEDKKVPVLSSIPLLGGLFKTKDKTTQQKEVVIFITPRLMKERQSPLANRHKMINVEKELKTLRDVVTMLDPNASAEELLYDPNHYGSADEGKVWLSSRHNLTSAKQAVEDLGEIVTLLESDGEPQSPDKESR